MGNERRPAEVRLFQMLFSQGDVCEGASLLYKRTAEKADAVLRRYWVRKLYRKSSGNPLLARAFGLLAGALAAAEAASPLLPAGFVRWLLLIAAFFDRRRAERRAPARRRRIIKGKSCLWRSRRWPRWRF